MYSLSRKKAIPIHQNFEWLRIHRHSCGMCTVLKAIPRLRETLRGRCGDSQKRQLRRLTAQSRVPQRNQSLFSIEAANADAKRDALRRPSSLSQGPLARAMRVLLKTGLSADRATYSIRSRVSPSTVQKQLTFKFPGRRCSMQAVHHQGSSSAKSDGWRLGCAVGETAAIFGIFIGASFAGLAEAANCQERLSGVPARRAISWPHRHHHGADATDALWRE